MSLSSAAAQTYKASFSCEFGEFDSIGTWISADTMQMCISMPFIPPRLHLEDATYEEEKTHGTTTNINSMPWSTTLCFSTADRSTLLTMYKHLNKSSRSPPTLHPRLAILSLPHPGFMICCDLEMQSYLVVPPDIGLGMLSKWNHWLSLPSSM